MGEDPQAIRREIEETRERMGDTVDALGYKADVKTRTKDAVSDKVDSIKEKVGVATDRVSDATPSTGDVKQGARKAGGLAKENPLGLAVGSVAIGFLAGMLVPTTRVEEEKIGPMASDIREKAMDAGQEAVERGKQVAQDALSTEMDT